MCKIPPPGTIKSKKNYNFTSSFTIHGPNIYCVEALYQKKEREGLIEYNFQFDMHNVQRLEREKYYGNAFK